MPTFEVRYSYIEPGYGFTTLKADSREEAEDALYAHIAEIEPDLEDVVVEEIKEVG